MDEETLAVVCSGLAGELATERVPELGKRWRSSSDLRQRVVEYARKCRERGETLGDISGRLGLVESTLARWVRKANNQATSLVPAFRSVSVVDSVEPADTEVCGTLQLITPRGYRIEGLDVVSLAYLLKELG